METKELIKKVRKIEIKTKGLSNQIFSGEYHSAFKGRGMAFSEVRDYAVGDEIRTIDWNVTARFNEPFVKVFEEERELTVMLLVDVSASGMFGTRNQLKRETITELCAVLAFSAVSNNDRIGLVLFSDPGGRRGRGHGLEDDVVDRLGGGLRRRRGRRHHLGQLQHIGLFHRRGRRSGRRGRGRSGRILGDDLADGRKDLFHRRFVLRIGHDGSRIALNPRTVPWGWQRYG